MGRVVKSFSFDNVREHTALGQLAGELGYCFKRGGAANVSALLKAIARRSVGLVPQSAPPAQLALVEPLLAAKQPFEALYQKADGEVERYRFLFARVKYRDGSEVSAADGHWYLEGYCTERHERAELPELAYNRCLRLDRLQHAIACDGTWQAEGMATVHLTLHLFGGLASNYTPVPGRDAVKRDKWLDSDTRQVVWRIDSYHWAKRAVLRYGAACQVVAPSSFLTRFKAEAEALAALYQ